MDTTDRYKGEIRIEKFSYVRTDVNMDVRMYGNYLIAKNVMGVLAEGFVVFPWWELFCVYERHPGFIPDITLSGLWQGSIVRATDFVRHALTVSHIPSLHARTDHSDTDRLTNGNTGKRINWWSYLFNDTRERIFLRLDGTEQTGADQSRSKRTENNSWKWRREITFAWKWRGLRWNVCSRGNW